MEVQEHTGKKPKKPSFLPTGSERLDESWSSLHLKMPTDFGSKFVIKNKNKNKKQNLLSISVTTLNWHNFDQCQKNSVLFSSSKIDKWAMSVRHMGIENSS